MTFSVGHGGNKPDNFHISTSAIIIVWFFLNGEVIAKKKKGWAQNFESICYC